MSKMSFAIMSLKGLPKYLFQTTVGKTLFEKSWDSFYLSISLEITCTYSELIRLQKLYSGSIMMWAYFELLVQHLVYRNPTTTHHFDCSDIFCM